MIAEQINDAYIIIDYRENRSGIPEKLNSLGTKFRLASLKTGDYLINNHILIERKSATDFVQSLVSNRLWCQCRSLRNSAFLPLIVIEGDVFNTPYQMDPRALQGALIAVSISWQLPILFSKDIDQTSHILSMIQSQALKEDLVIPYPVRKPKRIGNHRIQFLCGLPGVGKVMAKKLQDRFGSIRHILDASSEELLAVKGMGNKTVIKIREFID